MEYEDKVIVCGDCGKEFTHTVDDQRRYAERGFTEAPKRCRECRQARKDRAAQAGPRKSGGGGGGGGGGRGGERRGGGGGGRRY
jgi:DNA replicative helicase MCM subunit Mcm2 (Cdc46/Mcm family)